MAVIGPRPQSAALYMWWMIERRLCTVDYSSFLPFYNLVAIKYLNLYLEIKKNVTFSYNDKVLKQKRIDVDNFYYLPSLASR